MRLRLPLLDALHHSLEREGRLLVYRNALGWQAEGLADALDWARADVLAAIDIGDAAAAGTRAEVARADHQHAFTAPATGYPADIAATEGDGAASTAARADHVHAHPDLSGSVLGHAKVVRISADLPSVNNSTVFVDATGLSFAIGANEGWIAQMYLRVNTSAVADIKLQWTAPAGASYLGATVRNNAAGTLVATGQWSTTIAYNGIGGDEALPPAYITFVNGVTAGTVQLQFAQNTAEVSDTKILANSVLLIWRVA